MAATDACDDADWAKDALRNPHLAAAVILHFRQRSRVDPDAAGDAMPSTSAPTRPMEWGRKIKRSQMMKIPRIFSTLRGEEETAEVAADGEEEQLEKKKGKRRASPQSPLEGYSSASASGGDERSRAARSTGVKTKVELQAVQVSLLEEKANLLKEMENWRRTLEQLRADNDKLQFSVLIYVGLLRAVKYGLVGLQVSGKFFDGPVQLLFKLAKQPDTIQQTAVERRPVSPPSSYNPRSKDFILLPDLNEPLQDCRL
ncbi:hypothetical protein ZIOFF_076073 [Zingiber officinale]|uniref:Uncharacterized protein n=1 Tax=Zingiber officinale TaxID=94328 RepID=A0A8J5EKF6_ZINOF|nr:hypothetical protein ZIOFF_076073 [Zingiber officinale]